MTNEQLDNLVTTNPAEAEQRLQVFTADVGGQAVSVNVERSLIPDGIAEQELMRWVQENAAKALAQNHQGHDKDAGGTLGERWTWVYRIAHRDGAVTILDAAE